MNRSFGWALASIISVGIGGLGAASAADMPLKAPPPVAVAPVINWSGWYVGLNAGGIWPNSDGVTHSAVAGPCNVAVIGCSPAAPGTNAGTVLAGGSTFNTGLGNGAGFIGGGQFGYNWQFNGRGVAGFETDIAWTSQNRSAGFASTSAFPGFPGFFNAYNATISSRLDYIGTVRGRLGFLAGPSFLLYGTGGLAYGGVRSSTIETALIVPPAACAGVVCPGSGGGSFSDTRVGWTAGAGGEWMFAPNWSAKLEYLYYDLGSVNYPTAVTQVCNGAGCLFNGVVVGSTTGTTSLRYSGSIARVGVNWHFNGPVVAKY
ncbi:MAG TPA: outer membrane beta-barrel protein [Steroidobacteraceae bacterium]|jgi:outer membrane immunogenic protein|nr:outer membrane beta-barrel protein [Steroidobacteraceae bacterium]